MDFLKQLALPQAVEHFHLLLLVQGMIEVVLFPYLGFLLGSSVLSYVHNRRGRAEGSRLHLRFAKDLVEMALFNKSLPTFLALIPAFSLVLISAQLMQSTESISAGLAGYGFVLLLVAVVLLYTYKFTFRLDDILEGYEGLLRREPRRAGALDEIEVYSKQNVSAHLWAGRYGVTLVALASFLTVSSMSIPVNPSSWSAISTVFDLFVSLDALVRVLHFAAFAAGITGAGILFFFFFWEGGRKGLDEEYRRIVRRTGLNLTTVSLLAQPALILLEIVLLPGQSLSGGVYVSAGLALLMLFVAAHVLYAYSRDARPRYAGTVFFAVLSVSLLLGVGDQLTIHTATKAHAAYLASWHEKEVEAVKAGLGIVSVVFTGEDIYNGRCSACHLFDQKKVGPAYKDVIPKYTGKKAQLVAFVLNPAKVDPAFPPMPNQGLKPAEADSIASYLLSKFHEVTTTPGKTVQGQKSPK